MPQQDAAALLKAPHEYLLEQLQDPATGNQTPIPEGVALAALEAMYADYRASIAAVE